MITRVTGRTKEGLLNALIVKSAVTAEPLLRKRLQRYSHVYDHSFRCAQGTKGNETRMP